MNKIVEKYDLCQKLCGLYNTKGNCFAYTIKACSGACIGEESVDTYNTKVQKIIDYYSFKSKSMLIIDKGRSMDERSAVWVENGVLRGYTYYNLNFQVTSSDILSTIITPLEHNKDAQHILQSYMRRNKRLKVIPLDD